MKIAESVLDLIGNTPVVQLNRVTEGCARGAGQAGERQPAASVKDRIGFA